MNKIKRYFKNYPDATIQDYNNQRHRMHVIQSQRALERSSMFGLFKGKHTGSKKEKTLLSIIKSVYN